VTGVVAVCGVLVLVGGFLAVVRAERGPSMLDRTVALDIVLTSFIAAVVLFAVIDRRADVVPVLVALSLVGFVGSVTVARFAAVEPAGERRVLSREEAAAQIRADHERAAAEVAAEQGLVDEQRAEDGEENR